MFSQFSTGPKSLPVMIKQLDGDDMKIQAPRHSLTEAGQRIKWNNEKESLFPFLAYYSEFKPDSNSEMF